MVLVIIDVTKNKTKNKKKISEFHDSRQVLTILSNEKKILTNNNDQMTNLSIVWFFFDKPKKKNLIISMIR